MYDTYIVGKDHFGVHESDDGDFDPVTHGYHHLSIYDGLTEELDDYDRWFAEETGELRKCFLRNSVNGH